MALLAIETFQVCLGVDENDPAPTVFSRGLRTLELARTVRDEHTRLASLGAFDPAMLSGKSFYVRTTPGTQSAQISAQNAQSVAQLVRTSKIALPVYVLTADDVGQNPTYVRVGVVSSDKLISLL